MYRVVLLVNAAQTIQNVEVSVESPVLMKTEIEETDVEDKTEIPENVEIPENSPIADAI